MQVLQSFAYNTKSHLEALKEVSESSLPDYAISVHGLKSSCRGICAEAAGKQAESLEMAAKQGDLNFVSANNQALIDAVEKLIAEIDAQFCKKAEKQEKPARGKPYREVLQQLKAACTGFKIGEIEAALNEIECFAYTNDDGLVPWLRENVNQMNFSEIAEKLSALGISE